MTEILFAGLKSDPLVKIALEILRHYEGVDIRYFKENELAPHGSYVICTSGGDFPSRFIREVKPTDFEKRSIETPEYALHAAKVFAINLAFKAMILEKHPDFIDFVGALRQMHLRLRPRVRTVLIRPAAKPRSQWSTGHHARRKNRDVYALQ